MKKRLEEIGKLTAEAAKLSYEIGKEKAEKIAPEMKKSTAKAMHKISEELDKIGKKLEEN
ncbi:MAG: hypothetical protein PHH26_01500 [Candidatus Thermoplasmatota archaeon]|nr:hypothetical protein [Candidatus Thermoplasmatota archaeon]